MLRIVNLETDLLGPISFDVPTGTCAALMGASGAGKTLLLRAIVDLDPNTGEVFVDHQARNAMSAQAWRRIVAYVPAESGWWSDRVGDHFPADVETETVLAAIGMTGSLAWEVARLSTGERQRLAIARALIQHPKVLLLDEPTASLDEDATQWVEALIQSCCRSNLTVLLVTHDHRQARRLTRQTLVMANGKICEPAPIAKDRP